MAARNKGVLEDLLKVASALPWYVGTGLAAVAFLILHALAALPANIQQSGLHAGATGLAQGAVRQLVITFATILQYVVPGVLLLGAAISEFRRRRAGRIFNAVAADDGSRALHGLSWQEFETLAGEAFRRHGFEVKRRGGNQPDGGVDLELRSGRDLYLVQCKHWKATRVGVATVRELFGVMAAEGAIGGFVVSAEGFTKDAEKFATGRTINLVSARSLVAAAKTPEGTQARPIVREAPRCPICTGEMLRRVATRGPNAGGAFWGCKRYPQCRGVVRI